MKDKFDFVLISKTLYHLRDGKCVKDHKCREDEKCCKYKFNEEKIFSKMLELGKRVIIYEWFFPQDKDDDKVRGRGGYFTTKEWEDIFNSLEKRCSVKFIRPQFNEKTFREIKQMLKQDDCLCFYVEKQELQEPTKSKN
jgi:hypothetical protein